MYNRFVGKFAKTVNWQRERGTAAQYEGSAGGTDQMGPNGELEVVKCEMMGVAGKSTKMTVNTCQRAPDLGEGSSRVHA